MAQKHKKIQYKTIIFNYLYHILLCKGLTFSKNRRRTVHLHKSLATGTFSSCTSFSARYSLDDTVAALPITLWIASLRLAMTEKGFLRQLLPQFFRFPLIFKLFIHRRSRAPSVSHSEYDGCAAAYNVAAGINLIQR